jgi:hypothetical protein
MMQQSSLTPVTDPLNRLAGKHGVMVRKNQGGWRKSYGKLR